MPASTATPASASSPGSASCRRRATSFSAGSASSRASTAAHATTTFASCATGRGPSSVEAMNPRALGVYGRLCASTLAHAHARSGDRIAIAAYLGRGDVFDRAILAFSEAYAEQNDRDFAALADAVDGGPGEGRPQRLTGPCSRGSGRRRRCRDESLQLRERPAGRSCAEPGSRARGDRRRRPARARPPRGRTRPG